MIIDLKDPRVKVALDYVKQLHNTNTAKELEKVFENQYHCKIIEDDLWCTRGHLYISEEKYQTWFILKFGDKSE